MKDNMIEQLDFGAFKEYIDNDDITSDDKEMIEDMLVVALNDAFKQIDKVTEQKMGKYSSMMPGGLF